MAQTDQGSDRLQTWEQTWNASEKLSRRIVDTAAAHGVTPTQLLTIAVGELLSRLTDNDQEACAASATQTFSDLLQRPMPEYPANVTVTFDQQDHLCAVGAQFGPDGPSTAQTFEIPDRLSMMLEAIVADPSIRVADIPILTPEEDRLLRVQWNDDNDYPQPLTLHGRFEQWVDTAPERTAIDIDGRPISYRSLNERANRIANSLISAGISPGRQAATLLRADDSQISALLGIMKSGGVFVGLDATHPTERLAAILDESTPFAVITRQLHLDAHPSLEAHLRGAGVRIMLLDDCDGDGANPDIEMDVSDRAYLAYTSGSTGKPKGIIQSHRSFAQFLEWQAKEIGIGPDQRFSQWASIGYDASYCEILGALCFGATLCMTEKFDRFTPRDMYEWAADARLNIVQVVPSFAREFLAFVPGECAPEGSVLPELRVLMLAGEKLPVDLVADVQQRLPKVDIYNLYGPSETVLATYHKVPQVTPGQTSISIGRAIDGRQILILDPDGRLCPIGVFGEIYIRSGWLTEGYFERATETRERYVQNPLHDNFEDPVFRTGDRARFNRDGTIDFLGRSDSLVKLRGMRVELGEIEVALREHEAVSEAVVLVREIPRADRLTAKAVEARSGSSRSSRTQQSLVAYLVADEQCSEQALRDFARRKLPKHMVPNHFVFVDALPRNANRKIDVKALPIPKAKRPDLDTPYVAARNDTQKLIAKIWQSSLNIPRVGVNDSFFELGGDSLLGMQVLNRIEEETGARLTYRDLVSCTHIEGLAGLVESADAPAVRRKPITKTEPREHYPLAMAQQGLWYLWNLEPKSPFYNALGCIHLNGELDLEILADAWQAMIDRHKVIRTRFERVNGEPVAVFDEARRIVPLPLEDLTAIPEAERDDKLATLAKEGAQQPFDLENDQLLRAKLYKLGEDRHELVFTYHEIIFDLWGFAVMIQDLVALYRDRVESRPDSLGPVEIDFGDYVVWEDDFISRENLSSQQSYWREQLAGELPVIELPIDRPRPNEPYYEGDSCSTMLSPELSEKLRELSRKHGTTLFTTLLTAFNVLLRTYSGQEDIIVGTPYANRKTEAAERLVGWFLNMLPIRTGFDSQMSFGDALGQVHDNVTGAISNSDFPFSWMLVDCEVPRDRSVAPVFQVMFNWQNLPQSELASGELSVSSSELSSGFKKYDLALYAQEHVDQIYLHMSYLSAIFEKSTVERMLDTLVNLLELVAVAPDRRLDELEVATDAEIETIAGFNATGRDFEPLPSIKVQFEQTAAANADRPAVIFEGQRLSFGELNARANAIATSLAPELAGHPATIAIYAGRSGELVAAVMAAVKLGATYIVLDPSYPPAHRHAVLQDTQPNVLLTQQALETPEGFDNKVVTLESITDVAQSNGANPATTETADTLTIVYTSASTGKAKGVKIPEQAIANRLQWMWDEYPFVESDVAVLHKSLAIVASTWELFGPLLKGIPLVVMSDDDVLDPARFFATASSNQVSHLLASPPVIEGILDEQDKAEDSGWRSLRFATTSAEAIAPALARRWHEIFPNVPLLNLYGSTECCSNATVFDTRELAADAIRVPVGKPIANVEVSVLSRAQKHLPIGAVGEMCVSGACVAGGYLNLPELTEEKFVAQDSGTLLRTGDLARYRADGTLELIGRRDRQINVRGFRVDPNDVEVSLAGIDGVNRCAVIARDEGTRAARLVAFVETDDTADGDRIRATLRDQLPEYMVPSSVLSVDALPLTQAGKVDLRALARSQQTEHRTGETSIAPRDDLELRLCKLWEEVLQVSGIGIQDHFFEVGGHSLLAVHVVNRIVSEFNQPLSLSDFIREPTVARIAQLIRTGSAALSDSAVVSLRSGSEDRQPFFAICGIHLYRELAENMDEAQPVYAIFLQEEVDAMSTDAEELGVHELESVEKRAANYLEQIRSVQPHGPYRLGGVSFGGLLAFEIAQQLIGAGEEVELLVIIDTLMRQNLELPAWRRWLHAGTTWIRSRLGALRHREAPDEATRLWEIRSQIHIETSARYEAMPYAGEALLVRAMDQHDGAGYKADPLLGWGGLLKGRLSVVDVPGSHLGCLSDPNVQALTNPLNQRLAELAADRR